MEYLIRVRQQGPDSFSWQSCCEFILRAKDGVTAVQKAGVLEPVIRRHSWKRIEKLQFDVTPLKRVSQRTLSDFDATKLRGFYGHLLTALVDEKVVVRLPGAPKT